MTLISFLLGLYLGNQGNQDFILKESRRYYLIGLEEGKSQTCESVYHEGFAAASNECNMASAKVRNEHDKAMNRKDEIWKEQLIKREVAILKKERQKRTVLQKQHEKEMKEQKKRLLDVRKILSSYYLFAIVLVFLLMSLVAYRFYLHKNASSII